MSYKSFQRERVHSTMYAWMFWFLIIRCLYLMKKFVNSGVTLPGSNLKGDPKVVWWCHCPLCFFVSLHALHLMLGWVLLLALQLGLGTHESLVVGTGEFFVHLVDSDTSSTGGCTIISVTPDFFLSDSRLLSTLPTLLSHPLPSIPHFYFPFCPRGLQCLALAVHWLMSWITVEGRVLSGWELTQGRAGWVDSVKLWVLDWGHSLGDLTAMIVIGCELGTFIWPCCSALPCAITSDKCRSSNQSLGLRVLGGWELRGEMQGWCGPCALLPTFLAECPGGGSGEGQVRVRGQFYPWQEDRGLGTITCWALRLFPE